MRHMTLATLATLATLTGCTAAPKQSSYDKQMNAYEDAADAEDLDACYDDGWHDARRWQPAPYGSHDCANAYCDGYCDWELISLGYYDYCYDC